MGKYVKGANGTFSGKVGSIIGSNWRGIDYLRSLPKKSTKGVTERQLAQREKFSMAPAYLRPIKDILNIGFGNKNLNKISGYNAAVKHFLTTAITGDYPNFEIDHSKMVISKGSLSVFHGLNAENSGKDINITWKNITNQFNSFADDQLILVMLDETKMMYLLYDGINRAELNYSLEVGSDFSGDVLHIWAMALKREGGEVSNSQYLGEFTAP